MPADRDEHRLLEFAEWQRRLARRIGHRAWLQQRYAAADAVRPPAPDALHEGPCQQGIEACSFQRRSIAHYIPPTTLERIPAYRPLTPCQPVSSVRSPAQPRIAKAPSVAATST